MNILLVYPEMEATITNLMYVAKLFGKKAAIPPLALMTVASMLPEEWNLKLIDVNVTLLDDGEILWADYVMISAMNVQARSASQIIDRCHKLGIKTIAGGTLFTHQHEEFPNVTHLILNEAEITFKDFLSDLSEGTPKPIYKTTEFADVTTTPVPNWSLVNLKNYLYAIVQYSRGCPYLCDFCDVTALFGRVPRVKSTAQIIAELDAIMSNEDVGMIFFADDNFIGNKNLLKTQLLPGLIEWRKRTPKAPTFFTQLTITLADDEALMHQLLEAGFRQILIGIETINEAALFAMRKKQNLHRDILANVTLLQKKGFVVIGAFIVGTDSDDESVFNKLSEFISQSGIVYSIVNVLKAPFGTELFERMKREGRLKGTFNFSEHQINFIPKMGEEKLRMGFNELIEKVYSAKDVYHRAKTYLTNLEPYSVQNRIEMKFTIRWMIDLLLAIFNLSILFKDRIYVWRLLLWTLFNKPNYLILSLIFSMIMYQYNKVKPLYRMRN